MVSTLLLICFAASAMELPKVTKPQTYQFLIYTTKRSMANALRSMQQIGDYSQYHSLAKSNWGDYLCLYCCAAKKLNFLYKFDALKKKYGLNLTFPPKVINPYLVHVQTTTNHEYQDICNELNKLAFIDRIEHDPDGTALMQLQEAYQEKVDKQRDITPQRTLEYTKLLIQKMQ